MASEFGESADVAANIVRSRAVTHDIARRIGIGSAPCASCAAGEALGMPGFS
jgi:glutamine---fructose-6-phosphate transaminase (isomerizing)